MAKGKVYSTYFSQKESEIVDKRITELGVTNTDYLRKLIYEDCGIIIKKEPEKPLSILERLNKAFGSEIKVNKQIITKKGTYNHKNKNPTDYWETSTSYAKPLTIRECIRGNIYFHNNKKAKWDMYMVILIKEALNLQDNQITCQQVWELSKLLGVKYDVTFKTWLSNIQNHKLDEFIHGFRKEVGQCNFRLKGDKINNIPVSICEEIIFKLQNINVSEYEIYKILKYYSKLGYSKYPVYCICKHYNNPVLTDLINETRNRKVPVDNSQKRRELFKTMGVGI